jgi:hypothetical protein
MSDSSGEAVEEEGGGRRRRKEEEESPIAIAFRTRLFHMCEDNQHLLNEQEKDVVVHFIIRGSIARVLLYIHLHLPPTSIHPPSFTLHSPNMVL